MENKNIVLYGLVFLGIGVFVGWLIWGNNKQAAFIDPNTHMMSDGTMMMNTNGDMTSMMSSMTADMQGKTGDALDEIFLKDMIVHHQGAVDMAKILAAGTKRPELQKMANDIITVQTKEIEMMKRWQAQWFK